MVKTYDGQLAGIRLLGFALPETATNQAGTVYAYESLATTLARAAGNYLPAGENLVARALECDNGSEAHTLFLRMPIVTDLGMQRAAWWRARHPQATSATMTTGMIHRQGRIRMCREH